MPKPHPKHQKGKDNLWNILIMKLNAKKRDKKTCNTCGKDDCITKGFPSSILKIGVAWDNEKDCCGGWTTNG